jgi:hypothetical protein
MSIQIAPRVRWQVGVLAVVALLVAAAMTEPRPGVAAKGYGRGGYGGGYKHCGRGCYTRKCTKTCGQAKRTCTFCATQDRKEAITQCVKARSAALAACAGDGPCRAGAKSIARGCTRGVKSTYAEARNHCGGLGGDCRGCCRDDYSASCTDSFAGTDGFGTYKRTVKRYGRVIRYTPDCDTTDGGDEGDGGGGGGEPGCDVLCAKVRDRELASCGRRKADPTCVNAVQERYNACVARCGGGTTTSTTLPTSSTSGALL